MLPQRSGRGFDRKHGVTTHAVLFLTDLDPETLGDAHAHATHYEAIPQAAFAALLSCVPQEAIPNATFVDVGAGMGRAVLMATEYPFKTVVGIELSPGLHQIALENIERAHDLQTRCRDVRLVRADARRARFPGGDLVVFLYNPFDGDALDDVLDRLAERRAGGRVWLLYHTPVHAERIAAREYVRIAELPDGSAFVSPVT